jgi:hypothetical protein
VLGLLVSVGLDFSPVGGDDDEPRMGAVILQPLDELVISFGVVIAIGRMCYLRIEYGGEFIARAEPPPSALSHADDVVRALLADLGGNEFVSPAS